MKKRIFALCLALVLFAMVFVSCGKEEIDEARDYIVDNQLTPETPYITLNMYIPANVVPETQFVEAMQLEFNSVIEQKYRTRVLFHFVKTSDYEATILAKSQATADAVAAGTKEDTTSVTLNDPYPIEASYQFDIFVSTSKSMLTTLQSADQLTNLTTYMTSTYNRTLCNLSAENSIYHLIYDNSFLSLKLGDDTEAKNYYFGVPANYRIGYYTYYVIEKAYADTYYFSLDTSIPIKDRITTLSSRSDYSSHVQEVDGDYLKRFEYDTDTYYVEVKLNPDLSEADIFSSMFCISANCVDADRAMQVIVELFTNSSLHTTLQYGAKNVTYKLENDADGNQIVTLIPTYDDADTNHDNPIYPYQMNMLYTGNVMNIIPCPQKGYDVNYAKYTYIQNKDSAYGSN